MAPTPPVRAALANSTGILILDSSGNTIGGATGTAGAGAGNVVSGNLASGVALQDGATGNIVLGNIVGLDSTGTISVPNGSPTGADGIDVSDSSSNTIGGTIAADRNIISGNFLRGLDISGSPASANLVEGNFIGTDISGTVAVGNGVTQGYGGVYIAAAGNTIGGTVAGAGNVIAGNGANGIRLDTSAASDNLVAGNEIGTNAAGTAALANATVGVLISNGGTGNTIGGATTAFANVISGNTSYGIQVDGSTTTGNIVANNWVGTGPGGSGSLPNGSGALGITNGAGVLAQGAFTGNVVNQGTLGFWNAPGVITITGNYTQSSAGTLDVDLGGTSLSEVDQLQVSGTATLAGTLDVNLIDGFSVSPLEEFQILTYGDSFRDVHDRRVSKRRHPLPWLWPDQPVSLFDPV